MTVLRSRGGGVCQIRELGEMGWRMNCMSHLEIRKGMMCSGNCVQFSTEVCRIWVVVGC